jgi:hypothetical protein
VTIENVRTRSKKEIVFPFKRSEYGETFDAAEARDIFKQLSPSILRELNRGVIESGSVFSLTLRTGQFGDRKREYYKLPARAGLKALPIVTAAIDGEKRAVARQLGNKEVYFAGPPALLPPSRKEKQLPALAVSENVVALWFHSSRVSEFGQSLDEARLENPTLVLRPGEVLASGSEQPARIKKVASTPRASAAPSALGFDPIGLLRARIVSYLDSLPELESLKTSTRASLSLRKGQPTLTFPDAAPEPFRKVWEGILRNDETVDGVRALLEAEGNGASIKVELPASTGASRTNWLRQIRIDVIAPRAAE